MPSPDIVNVVHPAVVRHLPPGCRVWGHSFVRVDTPARLRTLSWSETEEGPVLPTGRRHWVRTRLIDGKLFRVIGDDLYRRGTPNGKHLTGAGLRKWLAGAGLHPRRPDFSEVMRCFTASPVVGSYGGDGRQNIRSLSHYEALGRISRDWRDEARVALTRFFETDLVLAGGVALVRYKGPNAQFELPTAGRPDDGRGCWIGIPRYPGHSVGQTLTSGFHYRVDRAVAVRQAREIGAVDPTWTGADLRGCPIGGVDDVWLTVHAILQDALDWLIRSDVTWEDEGLRERATPYAERAATHMLRDGELPEACGIAEALCMATFRRRHDENHPRSLPGCEAALDYIRDYARPVLDEHGLDPEDGEALAVLIP